MDNNNLLRIGIIGAGPSGLTLALALSKRENTFITVFEKAPDHRNIPSFNPSRSYTIDITGHGARAVKYLKMVDRFNTDLIKFKGIRIPILQPTIEEGFHTDGWTGSRGDIVKAIQEEIIQQTASSKNIIIHFDTEAKVTDAENGIISHHDGSAKESFDLIVGCDGAGSSVRNHLKSSYEYFQVVSKDNDNYSMMLAFDQNTNELDPSYLYVFGLPPFQAVAGAINGKKGPTDPLWFCQIAFSGSRKFNSFEEAKTFLTKNYPGRKNNCVINYASEKSIQDFAGQENIATGRAKTCSSFHVGKVVLLGDAASPFPPVGQGVNAAMEMAIVLDGCIGEQLAKINTNSSVKMDQVILEAIQNFTTKWKPEASAISDISFHGLNLKAFQPAWYGKIKIVWIVLLHKVFNRDAMTNAKREDMSYSQALSRKRKIDFALYSVGIAVTLGIALFKLLK